MEATLPANGRVSARSIPAVTLVVTALVLATVLATTFSQGTPLVRGSLVCACGLRGPGGGGLIEHDVQLNFVPVNAPAKPTTVTTDSQGRFSLRLKPGAYKVVIPGPGAMAFENGRVMQPQN